MSEEEVKFKVAVTIFGLPEDDKKYYEEIEAISQLLTLNGYRIDVGIGEEE